MIEELLNKYKTLVVEHSRTSARLEQASQGTIRSTNAIERLAEELNLLNKSILNCERQLESLASYAEVLDLFRSLLLDLEQLSKQWKAESMTRRLTEWERGYNKSCFSRAEDLEEILAKFKGKN